MPSIGIGLGLKRSALPQAFAELNLLSPTLDPRITFTGGPISYVGSDGLLHTSAANAWPLSYDPVSLQPVGRAPWEQRTNLCTWSNDATKWGLAASGVATIPVATANYATAPDGAATASRLQLSLNGGSTISDRSNATLPGIVKANGTTYTQTVYLKSNTGSTYTVLLRNGATSQLVTVTPTWSRGVATETTTSDQTVTVELRGTIGTSSSADIQVWGGQCEAAATPGPVILTSGTQVTRAAQVATVNDLTTLRFNPAAGTWFSEFVAQDAQPVSGTFPKLISTDTGQQILGTSGSTGHLLTSAGTNLYSTNALTWGAVNKGAVSYDMVNRSIALNGVTPLDAAISVAFTTGRVTIGAVSSGAGGWDKPIRRIRYYPRKLSDAELQALTT